MAGVYITRQGDTWDLMAYNLLGNEAYMRYLIEANWKLLDILVFPAGIEVVIPDIPDEIDEDLPEWRSSDDEEELEEEEGAWEDEEDEDNRV